ncbi:MAG TPA: 6-phosphogluconolactonase, partial [Terriglobia bacterium]|nr:6-phosphogluconolactonase [Terriglobia bacterium]
MPSPEIRIFKDLETLSRAAAAEFTALAAQITSDGKLFSAALSGGSTPKRFYELLAAPEFSSKVPWPRVHLFQVDERCVPPDDAESNYRMIRQAMLDGIPLPAVNFHRMPAEQPDHEGAAQRYETELRETLGAPPPAWPIFD